MVSINLFHYRKNSWPPEEYISRATLHLILLGTMKASSFRQLMISHELVKSCKMVGRNAPDEADIIIFPRVLNGEDTLCIGHTKAETFVIPILEVLCKSPPPRNKKTVFAWIVTPTRNLASEICEHFKAYGYSLSCGFTSLVLYESDDLVTLTNLALLPSQRYIIAATPQDIYAQFSKVDDRCRCPLSFSNVRYLVLYEADQFWSDDCSKLDVLPLPDAGNTHTYIFAATDATEEVKTIQKRFLRSDYSRITLASKDYADVALKQHYCICADAKDGYVLHILQQHTTRKAVVFVDEFSVAHKLALMLSSLGLKAIHIIDEMNKLEKRKALETFKTEQCDILVCSSLASEGLNIPPVDVVINYDLSVFGIRSYFCRIGRAARARGSRRTYQLLIDNEEESELKEAILEFLIDKEEESIIDKEVECKLKKAILESTWKNISKFSVGDDEIRKLKSEARKAEREARKQLLQSMEKKDVKVEVGAKRKRKRT